MIQNKELYSYIINSIEVMNKSIIVGEQNTVKLFTYVYNNQNNIYNEIDNLSKKYNNIDINLENKILKNNKIINNTINENDSNLIKKISKLELKVQQLEKQLDEQICNTIITPLQMKIYISYFQHIAMEQERPIIILITLVIQTQIQLL